MISVKCDLKTYPTYSSEEEEEVYMESHGIHDDRVVLTVNGQSVVVLVKDLKAAIQNCSNSAIY